MVTVEAPYNIEFIRRAGELGGAFRNGKWLFSYQEEIEVRNACEKYFGYNGLTDPTKIDVRVVFNKELVSAPGASIDILGRPIARITNKVQHKPLIAPGTLIKSGSITSMGTRVVFEKGTTLLLRSVPMSLYNKHQRSKDYTIEKMRLDNQALELLFYEHESLIGRLKEINQLLEHAEIDPQQFQEIVQQRRLERIAESI